MRKPAILPAVAVHGGRLAAGRATVGRPDGDHLIAGRPAAVALSVRLRIRLGPIPQPAWLGARLWGAHCLSRRRSGHRRVYDVRKEGRDVASSHATACGPNALKPCAPESMARVVINPRHSPRLS